MCHLYPYNNVKLLRKFFYINLYSAHFCSTHKALWHGSHSFTCNYNAYLYLVSVHQMAPPQTA